MLSFLKFPSVAFAIFGIVSCSGSSSQSSNIAMSTLAVLPENPYGGFPVEPPSPIETVLTISVNGEVRNYSLENLAQFEVITVSVFEPFIQQDSIFSGVELSKLFDESAITGEILVNTVALNEYSYSNTAKNFISSGAILAYKQNDLPIPMDRGGPIRIVIPNDRDLSKQLDAWNWSIRSFVVN